MEPVFGTRYIALSDFYIQESCNEDIWRICKGMVSVIEEGREVSYCSKHEARLLQANMRNMYMDTLCISE